MKLPMLVLLALGIGHFCMAQGDLTGIKQQRIIAKQRIKTITCYSFNSAARRTDSILIDSMVFSKKGLMLKQYTNGYIYANAYNAKGMLVKQTMHTLDDLDTTVTMFHYDTKGNMVLSETVKKWDHTSSLYPDFTQHYFEYGPKGQILHEYWKDPKGKVIERQRYKYITNRLEKGVIKVVEFYDEKNAPVFFKKYYKNGLVKDYSIDNGKITFAAQSILNPNHDLLKFTDYYHLNDEDQKQVARDGHGLIRRDTLTEIYKYNKLGFCSQKLIYVHNKLTEIQKWYFKH